MGGYLLNYNMWRTLHESVVNDERYREAVNEQTVANLVNSQTSIESLVSKMGDIATAMGEAYATFINEWKQNAKVGWMTASTDNLTKNHFTSSLTVDVGSAVAEFTKTNSNEKYIKPTFNTTVKSIQIKTAKGLKVPTLNKTEVIWTSAPAICKSISALNHQEMFKQLETVTSKVYADGLTIERMKDMKLNDKPAFDMDETKKTMGKAYWPYRASYINGANLSQTILMWDGSNLKYNMSSPPASSSLGGGLTPKDFPEDPKRLLNESLTKKFVFYTVTDFVKGGGQPYTEFTTTTVSVPIEGGEEAVQVTDELTSLPGLDALFGQGKDKPDPTKEKAILEALNQILGQYSKITSIKVQGSASWEWTAGARDDKQNMALATRRAQWFVTKIGAPKGVQVSLAGTPAVVQPDNNVNTAPEWRVVNFFITGDRVEKRKLPTKWINVTETGEVTLNYDALTIKEYTVAASWKSPGLVTSIGWGKGEGKAEEKAAAKAEKKANRAVKENRIKFKELKPEQEIVIFDKSTPPNEVGGTDTKKIFVVGPGTEKGTMKVKLMDYTDPNNPKLIKEVDIPEERYVTHIEKATPAGEDNI